MGVTETSIALPAGGFWAARTARDIPHMRGYPVRRGLSAPLRAKRSNPRLRTPRYGLLRCARNDDVAQSVRPIGATGKSLQSLSIPVRKNNPLAPSGKSAA
jgi:hypothetical protein